MPVSEQTTVNSHTGNGVTDTFAYQFRIFVDSDLVVTVDDIVQTLTTDYTVTGAGDDDGGTVVFVIPPLDTTAVVIFRDIPLTRDTDLIQNGGILAQTSDDDADRGVMLTQQNARELGRSIKLPISETDDKVINETPAERANKVLAFDGGGAPVAKAVTDLTSILSTIGDGLDLDAGDLSIIIPTLRAGAAGTANAMTATVTPAPVALVDGLRVQIISRGANTITNPTLDLNSFGAKTIIKGHLATPLVLGDIPGLESVIDLVYSPRFDAWRLVNPQGGAVITTIQSGQYLYATGAGPVNAMTAAFTPTLLVLTEGMEAVAKVNLANTIVAPTVEFDGLGPLTVTREDGTALLVGDMPLGHYAELRYDGTDLLLLNPAAEIPVGYILIRDEKASGVDSGTFTQDVWQTRDLNVEVADAGAFASVAANQVTLAAGTYRFRAVAMAFDVNAHRARLQNITDAATVEVGVNAAASPANDANTGAVVMGKFTITASKVFELQHICSTTAATEGFGRTQSFGVVNVYASIEFFKEV